jgi:hypothetical protein
MSREKVEFSIDLNIEYGVKLNTIEALPKNPSSFDDKGFPGA